MGQYKQCIALPLRWRISPCWFTYAMRPFTRELGAYEFRTLPYKSRNTWQHLNPWERQRRSTIVRQKNEKSRYWYDDWVFYVTQARASGMGQRRWSILAWWLIHRNEIQRHTIQGETHGACISEVDQRIDIWSAMDRCQLHAKHLMWLREAWDWAPQVAILRPRPVLGYQKAAGWSEMSSVTSDVLPLNVLAITIAPGRSDIRKNCAHASAATADTHGWGGCWLWRDAQLSELNDRRSRNVGLTRRVVVERPRELDHLARIACC